MRRASDRAFAPKRIDCLRGTRRYERLVVKDPKLSALLWSRCEELLKGLGEDLRPLGFACGGEWSLAPWREELEV